MPNKRSAEKSICIKGRVKRGDAYWNIRSHIRFARYSWICTISLTFDWISIKQKGLKNLKNMRKLRWQNIILKLLTDFLLKNFFSYYYTFLFLYTTKYLNNQALTGQKLNNSINKNNPQKIWKRHSFYPFFTALNQLHIGSTSHEKFGLRLHCQSFKTNIQYTEKYSRYSNFLEEKISDFS